MRRVDLLVAVTPEPGADADETEKLSRQLRNELRSLDVDDVVAVRGGEAPAGSKGVDGATITELLVSLSAAGAVFATVVATVRDWLSRRSGGSAVTLTIDGDTLVLNNATAAEKSELIDTFVRRHQQG